MLSAGCGLYEEGRGEIIWNTFWELIREGVKPMPLWRTAMEEFLAWEKVMEPVIPATVWNMPWRRYWRHPGKPLAVAREPFRMWLR